MGWLVAHAVPPPPNVTEAPTVLASARVGFPGQWRITLVDFPRDLAGSAGWR